MLGKRFVVGTIVLVAVLVGVHWWTGRGHKLPFASPGSGASSAGRGASSGGHFANRVVPVVTTTVEKSDVPVYLDGLGNVIANYTVTVKSLVDGRLDKVFFTEGQQVHRGQQLAQVDPRPFEVQLHQAEGALDRDQAQLRAATLDLHRYQGLARKHLVSQQQADDQGAVVGQAEGAVRVDQAQIEAAKLNLDYARITSPIDGVTGVRLVDPGNIVHASDQTGIVLLTQLDPIAVIFSLPEDVLPEVEKELAGEPLAVQAFSRDGSKLLGTGRLELIDNQINQATASIRLKAIFRNPKRALWPNEFVKTRLVLMTRHDAIAVPATVVQRGPKGTYAYVVEDHKAKIVPIEVDTLSGDDVIVKSGLKAGDEVVVEGQSSLRPGARVTARSMNQPPGQRGKFSEADKAAKANPKADP